MIYKDCSAVVDALRIWEKVNLFGNYKTDPEFEENSFSKLWEDRGSRSGSEPEVTRHDFWDVKEDGGK